jgi:hypothetical protein
MIAALPIYADFKAFIGHRPTPAGQESVWPVATAVAAATRGDLHDVPIR